MLKDYTDYINKSGSNFKLQNSLLQNYISNQQTSSTTKFSILVIEDTERQKTSDRENKAERNGLFIPTRYAISYQYIFLVYPKVSASNEVQHSLSQTIY